MADRLTAAERINAFAVPGSDAAIAPALLDRACRGAATEMFREFWKYTPTAEFIDGLKTCAVSRPEITGLDQTGITVQTLGESRIDLQEMQDQTSAQRFPLADLALMLTGDLIVIDVAERLGKPLEIRYRSGLSTPVLLRLATGTRVNLIEQALVDGFLNHSLYVQMADDVVLEHAFAATSTEHSHWAMTQIQQSVRSQYRRQQYLTGARRRRSETQILLNEPEASAAITGAYVVEGGTHLDQQIIVEHRASDTTSHQRFHGIGAGKGTAVFNGRIHIHPGAPRADAALSNRNLSLHPDAIINTKPELEIYTDDVRCAHGATVGQISEDSLFYLRSRGLPPAAAKRMLCRAFINECIEGALAEPAEHALLGDWTQAS